ncbi:MAG: hypothetical protein JSW39_24445 [Desulfobacterales bacterium]|nr:MAG: hypothetical protein JSW39_24445 [Desulfobacterales bacterium]
MRNLNSPHSSSSSFKNRRSGLDRRWIIAPHNGPERRSGKDRRNHRATEERAEVLNYDLNELETFRDLLMANSMQLDAIAQLLIEKGFFSKEELFEMLKRIQSEYEKRGTT